MTKLDQYDEVLDESGLVTVCGMQFAPSRILKELDPTAYRVGFNDWLDQETNGEEDASADGSYDALP